MTDASFYAPVTILRFAHVYPSVCPSVRHALPQFLMDLFETLHTCFGHTENVHVSFLVELELILTELQPFELSHLGNFLHCRVVVQATFCIIGYGVCVINSSYSFQWIILKPCILQACQVSKIDWSVIIRGARPSASRDRPSEAWIPVDTQNSSRKPDSSSLAQV